MRRPKKTGWAKNNNLATSKQIWKFFENWLAFPENMNFT